MRIDVRFAADASQFEPLAKELVSLQPNVILAQTTPLVAEASMRRLRADEVIE